MTRRRWSLVLLLAWVWGSVPAAADISTQLYATQNKPATTDVAVTDSVIWTPAAGYRIVLQGCVLSSDAANKIELESSNTDVIPPQHFESYGSLVIQGGGTAIWTGTADATLAWTTTTNATASIVCWGFEVLP